MLHISIHDIIQPGFDHLGIEATVFLHRDRDIAIAEGDGGDGSYEILVRISVRVNVKTPESDGCWGRKGGQNEDLSFNWEDTGVKNEMLHGKWMGYTYSSTA